MTDIKDKIKKSKKRYKDNKDKGGFTNVPAGVYRARLQNAEFVESQFTNDDGEKPLQIHREHVITEGDQDGRVVHDWIPWGSYDWAIGATNQWLTILGLTPPDDNPEDLYDLMIEATDIAPTVKLRVSYKEGRKSPNIRVMSLEVSDNEPSRYNDAAVPPVIDDDEDLRIELLDFCEAHKIDTDADDDLEAVKKKIKGSKLTTTSKLSKGDKDLLKEAGIKLKATKKTKKK